MANAAWLALAVMAHNLGRAVGQLGEVRTSSASPQRRCEAPCSPCPDGSYKADDGGTYGYPARWPLAEAITTALGRIHAIPLRC